MKKWLILYLWNFLKKIFNLFIILFKLFLNINKNKNI